MEVLTLHGSSKELIMLSEQEIVQSHRKNGYEVREVDGKSKESPSRAFDVGLFDIDPVLVVVRNPTSVSGLKAILSRDTNMDVLVVRHGALPKSLSGFPSHELVQPKHHKLLEECSRFLIREVEKHGRTLDEGLARAAVSRVGYDFGVLRWEALKMGYCGEGDLTPKEVVGVIAPLSEAEGLGISEAILSLDVKAFLRECERYEQSRSGDQTMSLCAGLLSRGVVMWVEVSARLKERQSVSDISSAVGLPPWVVENKIIPKVRAMGLERAVKLLGHVSDCSSVVLRGGLSPWAYFKSGVLRIILS